MSEASSLTDLMKQNARLKKHAAVAKKVVAQRDFAGPEGEYICRFEQVVIRKKGDKTYFIMEFKVDGEVEGQEEQNGARLAILHGLHDTERSTLEQALERLMTDIQKFEIDTANMEMDQIDKALKACVGQNVLIRCVKAKKTGQTGFYYNLQGIASAGRETPDYSLSEKSKATQVTTITQIPEDAADEWNEEVAEAEEELAGEDLDEVSATPSDWIGYPVNYKPAKSPKVLEFTVESADDEAGTVVLVRDGKKLKAKFSDLILD